jgi:tungstate transport system ATP-binding protein
MVFQRPVLLRRSALANIRYALALRGVDGSERRARAEAALARFGLAGLARRPARVLSGGEQQRLALARAWAIRPEILFLDEPTAALDPAATRAVEEAIAAFDEAGTKIVMTTHDLAQARRLADEVLFLVRGRLVEMGPAAGFFAAPKSAEGRAFIAGELLW